MVLSLDKVFLILKNLQHFQSKQQLIIFLPIGRISMVAA